MRTSEQTCVSMGLNISMWTSWCPMLPNWFGDETPSLMPLLQTVRSFKLIKGVIFIMLKYSIGPVKNNVQKCQLKLDFQSHENTTGKHLSVKFIDAEMTRFTFKITFVCGYCCFESFSVFLLLSCSSIWYS